MRAVRFAPASVRSSRRPNGRRQPWLLRDAELAEVELVGADVLRLRYAGEPLLGDHPVLVVTEVQIAPRGRVRLGRLDEERGAAGRDGGVQHLVDGRNVAEEVVDPARLVPEDVA